MHTHTLTDTDTHTHTRTHACTHAHSHTHTHTHRIKDRLSADLNDATERVLDGVMALDRGKHSDQFTVSSYEKGARIQSRLH